MNEIQVTAKASTSRTGKWFQRNRYTTELSINDVQTGLHVHHHRKDALEVQEWLVDNSQRLLHEAGLYEGFYYMFAPEPEPEVESKLPKLGQKIELAVGIGQFGPGTKGTAVAVETGGDPAVDPENLYPVLFAPDSDESRKFPLGYGEWKVSA